MLGTPVLRVPARRTLVLGTLLLSILNNAHLNKMIFVIFLPALQTCQVSLRDRQAECLPDGQRCTIVVIWYAI